MAIGLTQWFSLLRCLVHTLNPLRLDSLGSKSNRFAILELECSWVVISFAARSLGSKKSLHTAFMVYIYNYFLLIKFSYDLLLIVIAKAFHFILVIFQESLTLEQLLAKIECGSQSVVVARWVKPVIEHAQDVPLVGEVTSGLYFYGLFVQSLFICSTFCFSFITCFFFVLVLSFSQKKQIF